MRRPSFVFFVLLASQALALDASAQPAPAVTATAASAASDDADRLFREGNELYKQKRFAEAEALFEKAFAKKPAHDIAANLGYAEMNQDKYIEAAEHLSYAVRIWPPTGKDDKRQGAIDRLAKVKAEVATLTIEVNAPSARVMVGDREVGTSPLAGEVFAEAGRVVVRVTCVGYHDAERAIDVAKGSAQTVAMTMALEQASKPAAMPTASVPATPPPPAKSFVPAAIAFGVGGAGLVLGIVTGALTVAKTSELSTTCGPSNRCPASARGAFDDANTLANVSNVGLVVAGLGGAVGIALLFLPRPKAAATSSVVLGPAFVGVKGAF